MVVKKQQGGGHKYAILKISQECPVIFIKNSDDLIFIMAIKITFTFDFKSGAYRTTEQSLKIAKDSITILLLFRFSAEI